MADNFDSAFRIKTIRVFIYIPPELGSIETNNIVTWLVQSH